MKDNLFGWSASLWTTIDQIGILLGGLVSIIALLGFFASVWAFFNKEKVKRWITRNSFPNVGEIAESDEHWDGLVFTVSHTETPNWVIGSRKPKAIALLATKESQDSANEIKEKAIKEGITVLDPILIENADDIKESQQVIAHLISRLQQKDCEQVAVDITGGKATMSLGAFMAAEEAQVSSLYVSSKFDKKLKQADMRTAKLITVSGSN